MATEAGLLNCITEACRLVRQECCGLEVDVATIVRDTQARDELCALLGKPGAGAVVGQKHKHTERPGAPLSIEIDAAEQRLGGMSEATEFVALRAKGIHGISPTRSRFLVNAQRRAVYLVLGLEPCSAVPAYGCSPLRIVQHNVQHHAATKQVRVRLFAPQDHADGARRDPCDAMTELITVLSPGPDAAAEFGVMWQQETGAKVRAAQVRIAEVFAPPDAPGMGMGMMDTAIPPLTAYIDVFRTQDYPHPLAFEADGWFPDKTEGWRARSVLYHSWNPEYARANLRLPGRLTPRLLPMDHNNTATIRFNRGRAFQASFSYQKRAVAIVYWPNDAKWSCPCVFGDPQQAGQRAMGLNAVVRCIAKEVWLVGQARRLRLVYVPEWLPDHLPSQAMLGAIGPGELMLVIDLRRFDGWPTHPYRKRFLVAQAAAGRPTHQHVEVSDPPLITDGFTARQTLVAPMCGLGGTVPGWPFTEWTGKEDLAAMNAVVKLYKDTTLTNAYLLHMTEHVPTRPATGEPKPHTQRSTPTFCEYVLTLLRCCMLRLDGPKQRIGLVLPASNNRTKFGDYVYDIWRMFCRWWPIWYSATNDSPIAPGSPVDVLDPSSLGANKSFMAENRLTIVFWWPSAPVVRAERHWVRERVEHHPWLCSEMTQAMLRTQIGSLVMGDVSVFKFVPNVNVELDVPGFRSPVMYKRKGQGGSGPGVIVFHRYSVVLDENSVGKPNGVPMLCLGSIAHTNGVPVLERKQATTAATHRRNYVRVDVFPETPLPLKLPDDGNTTLVVFDWLDEVPMPWRLVGWSVESTTDIPKPLVFDSSALQKAGYLPVVPPNLPHANSDTPTSKKMEKETRARTTGFDCSTARCTVATNSGKKQRLTPVALPA